MYYIGHPTTFRPSSRRNRKGEKGERKEGGFLISQMKRHGRFLLECWTSGAVPCRCRVFFAFTLWGTFFLRIAISWHRANSRYSAIFDMLFYFHRTTFLPFLRTSISRLPSLPSATLRAALRGLVVGWVNIFLGVLAVNEATGDLDVELINLPT